MAEGLKTLAAFAVKPGSFPAHKWQLTTMSLTRVPGESSVLFWLLEYHAYMYIDMHVGKAYIK